MSWWDATGFSSFASNALKQAQQKIDKVLDIKEEEESSYTPAAAVSTKGTSGSKAKQADDGDGFWNAWLGATDGGKASSSASTDYRLSSTTAKKEVSSETKSSHRRTWSGEQRTVGRTRVQMPSRESNPAASAKPATTDTATPDSQTQTVSAEIASVGTKDVPSEVKQKERTQLKSGGKLVLKKEKKKLDSAEMTGSSSERGSSSEKEKSGDVSDNTVHSPVDHSKTKEMSSHSADPLETCEMSVEKNIPAADEPSVISSSVLPKQEIQTTESDLETTDIIFQEESGMVVHGNETSGTSQEEMLKHEDTEAKATDPVDSAEESVPVDKGLLSGSSENIEKKCEELPQIDVSSSSDTMTESAEIVEPSACMLQETEETQHYGDLAVVHGAEANINDTTTADKNEENPEVVKTMELTDERDEINTTVSSESVEESEGNQTLTSEDLQALVPSSDQDLTAAGEGPSSSTSGSPEEKKRQEDTITSSMSSSSSFVKCMLEEAMVESVKDKDTDSHSSSDMVRIESGHNSGHTSGDEIDTTTSSDIEIISTPTPNGDNSRTVERPFDLSPLRHALSRSVRRSSPPGHKRSDSGSSGQSRNGDDLVSPDFPQHHLETSPVSEDSSEESKEHSQQGKDSADSAPPQEAAKSGTVTNDPLETEKLLKAQSENKDKPPKQLQTIEEIVESGDSACQQHGSAALETSNLLEKLAETAEILDARERKLLDLSKENMELREDNCILRNQLQQAEEARQAEMADVDTLTSEFTQRIAEAERKLQLAAKDRESLKKQLESAQAEMLQQADIKAQKLMKEKDGQIEELMAEGEKLSKQQLQSNNIIKKLRAKEKDNESVIKSLKQKQEDSKKEIQRLHEILDSKEDMEKKQTEAINQLNDAVLRQEKEAARMMSDLEDAQEKARSMQVALDNSYKELAELHRAHAAHQSNTQEIQLSAEMQVKEEVRLAVEKQQQASRHEHEALINQIEDLRLSLARMEKEHGRREDILRQEICDLQQRLQEAEDRNQELSQSVTAATRPLLRQIENIQSTYAAQSSSYEKVERNLTERLGEAQTQLATVVEKERSATEKLMDMTSKVTTLESQVSSLKQEKSKLIAQQEIQLAKLEVLEDAKTNEAAQLEALRHNHQRELSEVKKEMILVENQLEMEKIKVETEKKKLAQAHEHLREKELQLQMRQSVTPPGSRHSREPSYGGDSPSMYSSFSQEEMLEKTLQLASSNGSKTSLYESLRQTGAASLMEGLQSQLKQKEGEILQLQSEIAELERTRESMARELVNLTQIKDTLEEQVAELPDLKKQAQETSQRYNALLQMYGEKVEEADELRLDLQDVNDMYKAQIEELLKSK